MMSVADSLADLLCRARTRLSGGDGEIQSLLVKVAGTLWSTGSDLPFIERILTLVVNSFNRGGRRGVSTMIKGWSNAIRSILALNYFNTQHIGYCRSARNCRFSLRRLGATPDEIDRIIGFYQGVCGIPPLLLSQTYWRILLREGDLSLYRSVSPLANLGRACPIADEPRCRDSESRFYRTTSREFPYEFDLYYLGYRYGRLCRKCPDSSQVPINSHASFESTREAGGKMRELADSLCNSYLFRTVGELVPFRPTGNLYDVFGNLVLYVDEWSFDAVITDVMYPHLRSGEQMDRRLGLFALDWAIRDLHREYPQCVFSSGMFLTFGTFPPELAFDGTLPSRVCPLAEEGYKSRVITVVMLSVSIIEGIARHFLDPPMRTDLSVKIGLLSKVKLYTFLVDRNNGNRQGVDSFSKPSYYQPSAISADLTTATDTPYRQGPLSLLRGFVSAVSNEDSRSFLNFAIDVGCSTRRFVSPRAPPGHVHRCGIMMGEGLSGTYLNVMSGIVRAIIYDFMDHFLPFFFGSTVGEAREFAESHVDMIQEFLDSVDITGFDGDSTQSGDDLVLFTYRPHFEVRRFLVLLYVVLGEEPSESTFYSSEYYATFTEEVAVKNSRSHGWTFVDTVKPRLYSSSDSESVSTVISRIRQIVGTLAYVRDEVYIGRVCDVVDLMIRYNDVLRDRILRYHLVLGFPALLGGVDHPVRLLAGTDLLVPYEDRELVMKLLSCTDEQLWEVKYAWASDDLPDEECAREVRYAIRHIYQVFTSLPSGQLRGADGIIDLHTYDESALVDSRNFPGHRAYLDELTWVKNSLGLSNLDELAESVSSAIRFRQFMLGSPPVETNPLIVLRNRREKLLSLSSGLVGDGHEFSWSSVQRLERRIANSYKGLVTKRSAFLDLLGYLDLPSLLLSTPGLPGEGNNR